MSLYDCPVSYTVSLLSSKWTVFILNELRDSGKRPSQLLTTLSPVSQKMLTASLKDLEKSQILLRVILQEKPIQVEYSLTEKGHGLLQILDAIYDWDRNYRSLLTDLR